MIQYDNGRRIYVYLAGPVSGVSGEAANSWRDIIQNALQTIHPNIRGVSPVRYEPVMDGEDYLRVGDYSLELALQITAKNRLDVKRSDIVLAYMPTLSSGTFQEIGWAFGMEKPIILVSPLPEVLEHPVIMGSCPWRFDSKQQGFKKALETIRGLFEEYAQ